MPNETEKKRNLWKQHQRLLQKKKKKSDRSAQSKRAKGKKAGGLLDISLNRFYFQICICLCAGSGFIADRYCLPGEGGEMMWTEFNWTRQQLHSGNRSSEDSSKMFSLQILLRRTNICRVLLSINTLIIEDTLILFCRERNVMTIAEEIFRKKKLMLNLTVSRCGFHTWVVIFTPGFDICVSHRSLHFSNWFPYVKPLNLDFF